MHFHHSAIFCLYSQAGSYKEVVIHSTVCFEGTLLHPLLILFFFLFHILWVIGFRQIVYLCDLFCQSLFTNPIWSVEFKVCVSGSL